MATDNPNDQSMLVSAPPGIPDYELLRRIGEGSFGEVWLARSLTGQYRAIKVVYRRTFKDSAPYEREFRGIQKYDAISKDQKGLVRIHHVGRGEADQFFYYVMEIADDKVTGQEINPERYTPRTLTLESLPFEECRHIGAALAAALDHLHSEGLIHRDIKLSNIIFVGGEPKLADIGLVTDVNGTLTQAAGTFGYIPPEGPGNVQADIYALGKVLYEITTGNDRCRFPDMPTQVELFPDWQQKLRLIDIINKACEPDRQQRHQSVRELLNDLTKLGETEPVVMQWLEWWKRRPITIAVAVCFLIASLTVPLVWIKHGAEPAPTPVPTLRHAPTLPTEPPLPLLVWKRQGSFPVAGFQFDPVESRGNIYVVGGYGGKDLRDTFVAPVNEDGSLGPWRKTAPLPEPNQGPGAVVCGDSILVALDNGTILRAQIKDGGELDAWVKQPEGAPWHGGQLALRSYRDHLYIFGGFHYVPYENVLLAPIQMDGGIGRWRQTSSMPTPQQHHSVHFYADRVYLVGGITTKNVILQTVHSAPVLSDGTIGTWRRETDLPRPLWYHNSVLLGNLLVVFGGFTGYQAGTSDDVLCGLIHREDGVISRWERIGKMPSGSVGGIGVVHSPKSGLIYLIGGSRGYRADSTDEIWSISVPELMDAYSAER